MDFKAKLLSGGPLVGTFLKTPSQMVCEVLAKTALDVVCLDVEHSPFDRRDIDACVFGLRAGGMASLVRVATRQSHDILNALDLGATGILAPHIITKDDAESFVSAAQYGNGRGYSGSTRAAGYVGKPMREHLEDSKGTATLIGQIEDAAALEHVEAILSVDGLDAIFIGQADLTVSMGYDRMDAPDVIAAVERICEAAKRASKPCGLFLPNPDTLRHWYDLGATFFLIGSDHNMLVHRATTLANAAKAAVQP